MKNLPINYIRDSFTSFYTYTSMFCTKVGNVVKKIIQLVKEIFHDVMENYREMFFLKNKSISPVMSFRLADSQIITLEKPRIYCGQEQIEFYANCLHEAWFKGAKCIVLPEITTVTYDKFDERLKQIEWTQTNRFLKFFQEYHKIDICLWPSAVDSKVEYLSANKTNKKKIPDLTFTFSTSSGHLVAKSFELRRNTTVDIPLNDELPKDIWKIILSKLKRKSLAVAAITCKGFDAIANDVVKDKIALNHSFRTRLINNDTFKPTDRLLFSISKYVIISTHTFHSDDISVEEKLFSDFIKKLPDNSAIRWPYDGSTGSRRGRRYYTIKRDNKIESVNHTLPHDMNFERSLKSDNIAIYPCFDWRSSF